MGYGTEGCKWQIGGGANGEVLAILWDWCLDPNPTGVDVEGSFGEFHGGYGGFDVAGIEEVVCRQVAGQDINVNDK